ncbi:putative nucleotide-diphospho-sugar transferase [Pelagicoccus sp. SDUM812003]|uniref:putative nucleotide-diphospho-sugar transferase n=1 Tax=Pelagicoccus sp. SDUM812003 TaxID=3041267 RepID=UPI00280EB7B2|nr:putative nucleotide-diphospho-sugar transferase [Pelagicoccus sp. SDUM812003]MDQ8203598.1 putative nucleotide-diphospho-sugar transferase [Pelagicoccus sp. SDUM812003]
MNSIQELGTRSPSAGTSRVKTRGVIYVVTGGRSYLGELVSSVKSLRRHEPDIPVTVFSRYKLPSRYRLERREVDPDLNPHKLKVRCLRESPYDETLFLDTDTSIKGKVSPLFDELKQHDFCVAHSHVADYSRRPPLLLDLVKADGYNTGVLLFRKSDPTSLFLSKWEGAVMAHDPKEMWAGHYGDQYFFTELVNGTGVADSELKFGILDNVKWNCRGIASEHVRKINRWSDVRIFHHRTSGMKIRKLIYSITDFPTAKVIAGKGLRLMRLR